MKYYPPNLTKHESRELQKSQFSNILVIWECNLESGSATEAYIQKPIFPCFYELEEIESS